MINLYLPYGSKKKHTGQKHQKIAELGGSGLALVALLSLEKISPQFCK